MKSLLLPQLIDATPPPTLPEAQKVTIIGANGAGKTRFMQEVVNLNRERTYMLSALDAAIPMTSESTSPGSIDVLYREAILHQPYMRSDAVSQLDKLTYMLFADEFDYLLGIKSNHHGADGRVRLAPTKLDRLKQVWEKIFQDSTIVCSNGRLMFSNQSGTDLITMSALSQGEMTALYYIAGVLYAMPDAVIMIDNPSIFLHPAIIEPLWDSIEALRPDCNFIYNSVDVDFVASRSRNICIWIKSYDADLKAWDYSVLESATLDEQLFLELAGSRKPVLFIEGDATHSIDKRLYSLVFRGYTVKPLGSCDKVIETTRTFNDLKYMHHLESCGIVDRDRRTDQEVEYLRGKNILVPDVAEIENIFLLESVISIMARARGKNPAKILQQVREEVIRTFKRHSEQQALMHVRHKMKRDVERLIDARFGCITALETHISKLVDQLRPREYYLEVREKFAVMVRDDDYAGILRVFNHKPMLGDSHVAQLLGFHSKEAYIDAVIDLLSCSEKDSMALRRSIRYCFGISEDNTETEDSSPKIFTNSLPPQTGRKKRNQRQNRQHSGHRKKLY